jgi:PAS domain-containing protein/DNA-binding CsgD family transcriptional regulator
MVSRLATFSGGGNAGKRLRDMDWSTTPLGQPEHWPEPLGVSLKIVLSTPQPMLIWWGDELVQFYNDGFSQLASSFLGANGLGKPGRVCWRDAWDAIGADVERVLSGEGGLSRDCRPIPGCNTTSDRYWSYSLSPIFDGAEVGGVLLVCRDETAEYRERSRLKERAQELTRIQHIGKIGGLEVRLASGFRNLRSPQYLIIHGLPPEAANETHEEWVRRIHPEDRHRTETAFIQAISGSSKGYSIQYRIIRPSDKKIRWILAKTEIERDGAGRAMRLLGAHADVTDQTDIRAVESARFTAALDALRCAVIFAAANGSIVYANRSADSMLQEGRHVRCRHGSVRAVLPSASRELEGVLQRIGRNADLFGNAIRPIRLSEDFDVPIVAHVLPLAATMLSSTDTIPPDLRAHLPWAVAAIFIRIEESARENARLISTTYELTQAETRVASCLLSGCSVPEAAAELQVAVSTVRTHLAVIFRKTGVSRQADLVMLSSRLSAPVRSSACSQ